MSHMAFNLLRLKGERYGNMEVGCSSTRVAMSSRKPPHLLLPSLLSPLSPHLLLSLDFFLFPLSGMCAIHICACMCYVCMYFVCFL